MTKQVNGYKSVNMRMIQQRQTLQIIGSVLFLLLLACSPLTRLQELNRKGQVLATGVAVMSDGNFLAFESYENLQRLPGYRLESRNSVRDQNGRLFTQTTISEYDAQGNVHTLIQAPDGKQREFYIIDDHTYAFEAQYNGWVDLDLLATAKVQQEYANFSVRLHQTENFMQLLPQFGTVPTEAGREVIQNRVVTRYELAYITAELAETFGNQVDVAINLQGNLWVDEQTKALLKSEIFLYHKDDSQPRQEFLLEVSEIGVIAPVVAPEPIVNPIAISSATATAQAWSIIQAELNYQGQPIFFELIPIQVRQSTSSIDANVEMQIALRQLPLDIPATEAESFLSQLGHQLSLSIPKHNVIIAADGFQIINRDSEYGSMEVIYVFQANLEDFSHVELILAGSGNPVFVPVPVADNQ